MTTPPRVNGKGKAFGGCAWSRGQIYKLLSNPVYLGLIEHKGERYQGLHPAIIDTGTWEHAQAKLAENLQGKRGRRSASEPSLLARKVEDEHGVPMIADHATKGTVRYRYYASRREDEGNIRVPARELEQIVVERVARLLEDSIALATAARLLQPEALRDLRERAGKLGSFARNRPFVDGIVVKMLVLRESVEIMCTTAEAATLLGAAPPQTDTFTLTTPARITRSGRVIRLVDANGAPLLPIADTSLIRLIAKAHRWWAELLKG